MKKEFRQKLSSHQPGDFYVLKSKYILNDIIEDKDFSEYSFKNVKFFNCIFKSVSFSGARGDRLRFYNCQFYHVIFRKTDFTDISFQNCQLFNCRFASAELDLVRYLNCQFNNVEFNASQLLEFEIDKSQLVQVSFGGSDVEDFTIQNSTLKEIECAYMRLCKRIDQNGIIITKNIRMDDSASFLREFVDDTSLVSDFELTPHSINSNDFEVLKSTILGFTTITSLAYCFLKPELFHFLANHF